MCVCQKRLGCSGVNNDFGDGGKRDFGFLMFFFAASCDKRKNKNLKKQKKAEKYVCCSHEKYDIYPKCDGIHSIVLCKRTVCNGRHHEDKRDVEEKYRPYKTLRKNACLVIERIKLNIICCPVRWSVLIA